MTRLVRPLVLVLTLLVLVGCDQMDTNVARVDARVQPISVGEQYKALSSRILPQGSAFAPATTARQVDTIAISTLLLVGATSLLIRRRDFSEEGARD